MEPAEHLKTLEAPRDLDDGSRQRQRRSRDNDDAADDD
jgi:hypothetical protein